MNQLPSSIEAHLQEAGFSGTEVLVIRKLLEEDALTIREIASKTGKSTGVLDQAMKKLLKKRIVRREMINEVPKYILDSLDAVLSWMKDDTQQKQQMIVRKYQNFESFLSTMRKGKNRPEMEYFEGEDGVKRAYMALLERGKVFLTYGPLFWSAEEDPLREFHAQYLRERRRLGIFSRVITHDTPLGRRYHSRDPFEYRQTVLVEQDRYPFQFEMTIVGDTVACFQLKEQRVCFIKYSEMAEEERVFFELLWYKKTTAQKHKDQAAQTLPARIVDVAPSAKSRLFSQIRDFFLGRRGVIGLSACTLLAGGLTFLFYLLMANANLQRIREQVKSVAATGALQFNAADLDELHSKADITKPQYAKVVNQLIAIRNQNPDLVYAYILRPTGEKGVYEYVADADSLNPDIIIDVNKDGKIDEADDNVIPGEKYVATDNFLKDDIFDKPIANEKPYTDKWGTFIDGTAPIRDAQGNINALLGVNKWAKDIYAGQSMSRIILFFALALFAFIAVWLIAFDQFVLKEVSKYMKEQKNMSAELLRFFFSRKGIAAFALCGALAALSTYALYQQNYYFSLQRIREQVKSIAATGAIQFEANDLNELHTLADITKPQWPKVVGQLNQIRDQNPDVKYIYILRLLNGTNYEFVADADSLDPNKIQDINNDGKIDAADENFGPGKQYDGSVDNVLRNHLYSSAVASDMPYTDQWGTFVSGWAPIKDRQGNIVGILGVDKWAADVNLLVRTTFHPTYWFLAFLLLFIFVRLAVFNRGLFKELCVLIFNKKVLIATGSSVVIAVLLTSIVYFYTNSLNLKRIQDKVISIAATGALQFDVNDLNELRTIADISKPQYAKVVELLDQIRSQGIGAKYAYIMRPTAEEGMWEFVADADGLNPEVKKDINFDGQINDLDQPSLPGDQYIDEGSIPPTSLANQKPTAFEPYYDSSWGTVISGWAPIKDSGGKTNAILGLDIFEDQVKDLTLSTINPVQYFIVIFIITLLVNIGIFNRVLIHRKLKSMSWKRVLLAMCVNIFLAMLVTTGLYQYTQHLILNRIQDKVLAISLTAASQFDANDTNVLKDKDDWQKPEWGKIGRQLEKIRRENTSVFYAYIIRKSKIDPTKMEFIGDADSIYPFANTDNDPTNDIDMNRDGKIDGSPTGGDYQSWPGQPYPTPPPEAFKAYDAPIATDEIWEDQWGRTITGYAQIKNPDGSVAAILAIDMSADSQDNLTRETFTPTYVFIISLACFTLFYIVGFNKSSQRLRR